MFHSDHPASDDPGAPLIELRANLAGRVDIVTLKLFLAVVEEASIAKAAEREHMAPSAVSKRLADLEQSVRVPLLERHRRGVSPTPAGEAFLRHSRKILRDLTQLECEMAEFSSASHGARGHVRAAANESALFGFFPDALSRFMRDYPNVTVELQPNTSTGAVQAVREGIVDFGIFWGDQPVDGLKVMPCYVDRLVVVVPQGHPLSRRRNLRLVDLLDHPLILQEPYSSIQNLTERLAAEAGRTLRSRIRVAGFDAVCRMAQAGLGIGIVPDYFVTDRAAAMHIAEIPLDEPWANRLHKLCVREDDDMAIATRLLVEFPQRITNAGALLTQRSISAIAERVACVPKYVFSRFFFIRRLGLNQSTRLHGVRVSSHALAARTLFDTLWERHVVHERDDGYTLLYIDRHYVGDDLPRDTFDTLARKGLRVRRPQATFAMADHYASSHGRSVADVVDADRRELVEKLIRFTRTEGVPMFALDDPRHGIVHVTGPEHGLTLPGMSVVCGDSHTSTHGALGAFGFGIGASEVSHVLATQTLWQKRPKTMRMRIDGERAFGVTAKDIALAMIARIGVAGGAGHVIEYTGEAVTSMSMEARMTLCNLSIEAGARAGMIAPDDTTFGYLNGRDYAPKGAAWDAALATWRALASDAAARFDREAGLDASRVAPMVTWGTNPAQSAPIDGRIAADDSGPRVQQALDYMGIEAGAPLEGMPVDRVFIGSCTNGRIEDLRAAAAVLDGRRVRVPTLVVPGSRAVQSAAGAEGLDRVFAQAGAQWGEPGCSMCLAINGDEGRPGERVASTTNRNFVGRQGRGVRTHLMSPGMAAGAAVAGRLIDYRELLRDATADAT